MYNSFGANTQQVAEGTVPSGITATVGTTTATISLVVESIDVRKYGEYAGLVGASIRENKIWLYR